jgi:FKBP-type peptidyl-prolyl cis-trans isomerase SlyD
MKPNNIPEIISDDVVVTMDYTLTVNGKQIGSSKKSGPFEFIQGQHDIIPGLEKNIYDMKVGDAKEVKIMAVDGYGEIDPEDFITLPKSDFPENIPLKPGTTLNLRDEDGDSQKARIDSVDGEEIRLNFNHPLAGKDLHFQVTILELRAATQDEIELGL